MEPNIRVSLNRPNTTVIISEEQLVESFGKLTPPILMTIEGDGKLVVTNFRMDMDPELLKDQAARKFGIDEASANYKVASFERVFRIPKSSLKASGAKDGDIILCLSRPDFPWIVFEFASPERMCSQQTLAGFSDKPDPCEATTSLSDSPDKVVAPEETQGGPGDTLACLDAYKGSELGKALEGQ